MKIPRTPPNLSELMETAEGAGRLGDIFHAASDPKTDSKYLHWDKLRHLRPPNSLTSEEWWLTVKMKRSTQMREISLVDTSGSRFRFALPAPIPERLHDIDLRLGGTLSAIDPIANPAMKEQYLIRSLTEEAITSSLLEGAATTRDKARELLRVGRKPRDHAERMIVNNYKTMQYLSKLKDQPLTPDVVCDIQARITTGTLEDPADEGHLRTREIHVGDDYGQVFHIPPSVDQLPKRIEAMCDFANQKKSEPFLHPALRAILLHFWLAYDHPFGDGNGRTARALFYWSMLRHGYWLAEFISISEIILKGSTKYGRAFLYTETDDNDLTYFMLHQLDVLRQAANALYSYIQRKTTELRVLERDMKFLLAFNGRQRDLLSHALRHRDGEYTVEWHRGRHGVVHQTARSDLLGLAEKGLLSKYKVGREWRFTPVPDLDERLRK